MINRVAIDLGPAPDRLRNPEAKPTWAQLSRLGGDRVAILFEDLRKRIGAIDGLVEDLHFAGREEGWVPRYTVGRRELFRARILPGTLEATVRLGASEFAALVALRSVRAATKSALESNRSSEGESHAHFILKNVSDVCSFSRLIVALSGLVEKD
jgi:hypothetical protein